MKLIPLTQGRFAQVDDEDFEELNKHKWSYDSSNGYPKKNSYAGKERYMHRIVMNAEKGHQVDHRDRDKLNNQKINLRFSTQPQNTWNTTKPISALTSIYKGVSYSKERKRWFSKIHFQKKQLPLGRYFSEKDAALAYDRAAEKYFGEFAVLNFPNEKTIPSTSEPILRRHNTTGFRGVQKWGNKWRAAIGGKKDRITSAYSFSTPKDAAKEYNRMAIERYGDKAKLNIIPD
jgi:hypothetical protein